MMLTVIFRGRNIRKSLTVCLVGFGGRREGGVGVEGLREGAGEGVVLAYIGVDADQSHAGDRVQQNPQFFNVAATEYNDNIA